MMPLSMNVTLMNHASLHSLVISSYYDLEASSPDVDEDLLSECVTFSFKHPKMIWPYFTNL